MLELVAVPVSAVGPDWIRVDFLPQLDRALANPNEGGTVWIHVDAALEGSYLLGHAQRWARSLNRRVEELAVREEDPYLLWEDLLGTPDCLPSSNAWPGQTIVLVENGTAVPLSFLEERTPILRAYCSARGWTLLHPILHDAARVLRARTAGDRHIQVPPFCDIGDTRRREVVSQILTAEFRDLGEDLRASLLQQLLETDPPPQSRTEIQAWIDFYRERPDVAQALREHPPPPLPRYARLPADVPTATALGSRLTMVVETLKKASGDFESWFGRRLFDPVRVPPSPFLANDPTHWFSAAVSYLSCWLESADSALDVLSRYEVHPTGSLEERPAPEFYRFLSRLRTVMQHGLDPGSAADLNTISTVESWYQSNCGTERPARQHWRRLTLRLLEDAQCAAHRLAACVTAAASFPTRSVVESQIRIHSRSLSREQWRSHLRESVRTLAPEIDPERLLEKCLGDLQSKLRGAVVTTEKMAETARQLADEAVARESAKCPITGKDLLAAGISPGPRIGLALQRIEAAWREEPTLSREALLAIATGASAAN